MEKFSRRKASGKISESNVIAIPSTDLEIATLTSFARNDRGKVSMQNFTDVKLETFVPEEYTLKIRDALAKIGVGVIGDYDHCVALYPIQGYYRPLAGAKPFEGEVDKINAGSEYKIEVNCKRDLVNPALKIIRGIHPYEEPLINIIPLANHLFEI
jgi:hypothetical protein